ncbi:MAG: hypothetical protein R3B06_15135 [Kofleriaceae bacterium]
MSVTLPAANQVFHALRRVAADASGALVRRGAGGQLAGALLIDRGRVCSAITKGQGQHLSDALVAESGALTPAQMTELVAECQREHLPLGETLVARGLVTLPDLRRALFTHTCQALEVAIQADASPWTWVAHRQQGYDPVASFAPIEVLAGVHALSKPALAGAAETTLARVATSDQRGFAIRRGAKFPLAQLRCEDLSLEALTDIVVQAEEVTALSATLAIEVTVTDLGGVACATWTRDEVLYVLLSDGELAFNRLLAQMAATSISH